MTLIDPKRVRSAVSQPVKQSPEKKVAAPVRAKVGASEFSTGRGSALRAQAPKRLTGTATAPNDAAASANDEGSWRKQNQFEPWFTAVGGKRVTGSGPRFEVRQPHAHAKVLGVSNGATHEDATAAVDRLNRRS